MARNVYSAVFIAEAGINGDTADVIVPSGHVYVVKQVGGYGNSTVAKIDIFLVDHVTGAALWHGGIAGATNGWLGYYGAWVFPEGAGFHMSVGAAPLDSGDVYAGGYDLTLP